MPKAQIMRILYGNSIFRTKNGVYLFFCETMSRNDFTDILQFIRFDFRKQGQKNSKLTNLPSFQLFGNLLSLIVRLAINLENFLQWISSFSQQKPDVDLFNIC
jgi:hypothetical protein